MVLSGWINFTITAVLSVTLIGLVIHYYRPGRKKDADKVEDPKFRMLDDDDEQ